MLVRELILQDVINILVLFLIAAGVGWVFYFILRYAAKRVAAKTTTKLDNFLLESVKLPGLAGIILLALYIAAIFLPFQQDLDFEIKRGFHAAFIATGIWFIISVLDSVYRWFKLEVAAKTQTSLDDWIIALLRIFTPIVALFLAVIAVLGLYSFETSGVVGWLITNGSRIAFVLFLTVVLIFTLGQAIPKAVRSFVARSAPDQSEEECRKRSETLSSVLVTTGEIFVISISSFIILSQLGLDIAPVLAGVGVAGIAIGFGAQSLVKDMFAGLFIILENQYRVGDVVRIADISGLVEQISLRRTVLRDMDGIVHVVSNGEIRVASNFTKEVSRVNLNISVSYGTDLERAIAVINRVCTELAHDPAWAPLILKTPQVLRVDKLGDSGVELKVLGETKPIRQWDVMGELRRRIKNTFDREGIEIPFPHVKVYFGDSALRLANNLEDKEGTPEKERPKNPS